MQHEAGFDRVVNYFTAFSIVSVPAFVPWNKGTLRKSRLWRETRRPLEHQVCQRQPADQKSPWTRNCATLTQFQASANWKDRERKRKLLTKCLLTQPLFSARSNLKHSVSEQISSQPQQIRILGISYWVYDGELHIAKILGSAYLLSLYKRKRLSVRTIPQSVNAIMTILLGKWSFLYRQNFRLLWLFVAILYYK